MEQLSDTVRPVYRFEWSDGTTRTTNDYDFVEDDTEVPPDTIEALAELGRRDPDCDVELHGYVS